MKCIPDDPAVSVVMVVCNVDRFLAESIESILGQTFEDFEFIIADFGSTDQSRSIVSSYAAKDKRIRFCEIPPCSLVAARNSTCSLARGQYLAIMDADDVSMTDRIALGVEFMDKHPEVGMLGGIAQSINALGNPLPVRVHAAPVQDPEIKAALAIGSPFCHSTLLIRREAFQSVGGFREVFAQAEDYDLMLRISERCQCAGLPTVVLKYRFHPCQISIQKQMRQTLCRLAARASASLRSSGARDPLSSGTSITPELLAGMGVSAATQQSELASHCFNWISNMCAAEQHRVALEAALLALRSDLQLAEQWKVAELHLACAQLYWREGGALNSLLALGRAVRAWPRTVGRPLKLLLRRAGFA